MGQGLCCGKRYSHGRILLLGLDSSGKTTILFQLKCQRDVYTTPTVGFNVEDVEMRPGTQYTAWDVGGQDRLRTLWKYYFKGTRGLIYVIDSADTERLDESKEELIKILNHQDMMRVPFVVLANKQDIPGALSCDEMKERLSLRTDSRLHTVQAVCAKTGEGLHEAVSTLSQFIQNPNHSVP